MLSGPFPGRSTPEARRVRRSENRARQRAHHLAAQGHQQSPPDDLPRHGGRLSVAGTTSGYTARSKTVTLTLDGKSAGGHRLRWHRRRRPGGPGHRGRRPRPRRCRGSTSRSTTAQRISVHFARPFEVNVDGEPTTYWVTIYPRSPALSARSAQRYAGADLSASRGGEIDRGGMTLDVVTPKKLTVQVGDGKPVEAHADRAHRRGRPRPAGRRRRQARPAPSRRSTTSSRTATSWSSRRQASSRSGRRRGRGLRHRRARGLLDYEGETSVVRDGKTGLRDVTYRIVYRNGELADKKVLQQHVQRRPVDEIVKVGTKASGRELRRRQHASGTGSRSARPAATGPSTPATATTAACSSPRHVARPTAAPACRATPAARPRSRSLPSSATPPAATAPGPAVRPSSVCPADPTRDTTKGPGASQRALPRRLLHPDLDGLAGLSRTPLVPAYETVSQ